MSNICSIVNSSLKSLLSSLYFNSSFWGSYEEDKESASDGVIFVSGMYPSENGGIKDKQHGLYLAIYSVVRSSVGLIMFVFKMQLEK